MRKWISRLSLVTILFTAVAAAARAGDNYAVDVVHSAVTFKASHLGLTWLPGRFKDFSGTFSVDKANPANSRFELTAKIDSVDTDNAKRDEHLKSPDFFNAKQFPVAAFKSTSVKANEKGYDVTGNLTLHGVTKPVSFSLIGGRTTEFPKGVQRTGFHADLSIKRSDFGMDKMTEAIGDEVHIAWSIEGTRK